jgi:SAM-dependent methyltransferase
VSNKYWSHVRSEIASLLPADASRIADFGCGDGATSAWLKTIYPSAYTIGIEGNGALRSALSRNVDEVHIVDLNGPLPDIGAPDLILLLDILEHLVQPENLLAHIVRTMTENATVVISLPNVAHLTISAKLFLLGRFDYADAGILDRTHLRFYYLDSALALIKNAGLEVGRIVMSGLEGPKSKLADRITAGLIRNRLAKQYLFAARRSELATHSV